MIYFSPEYEPEDLKKERLAQTWNIADIETVRKFAEDEAFAPLRNELTSACHPLHHVIIDFKMYVGFILSLRANTDHATEDKIVHELVQRLHDKIFAHQYSKEQTLKLSASLESLIRGLHGSATAIDQYIKEVLTEKSTPESIDRLQLLSETTQQYARMAAHSFSPQNLVVMFRYIKEAIDEVGSK